MCNVSNCKSEVRLNGMYVLTIYLNIIKHYMPANQITMMSRIKVTSTYFKFGIMVSRVVYDDV
jgi:hypothetical protein